MRTKKVGNKSFKLGLLAKGSLVLAAGAFLGFSAMPANAGRLGSNGSGTSGAPTGNYLFTYYDIGTPVGKNTITPTPNFGTPGGDNVIRLVDPNGCGNSFVPNSVCASPLQDTVSCALIYVFDDDQEMGECCPCFLTANEVLTISVRNDLVSNWALATQDNSRGTIVVIGSNFVSGPNFITCDPTVAPNIAGATNFVGSITHDQTITGAPKLTEVPLFDQGAGETVNKAYLAAQCGALVANGSGDGICECSDEFDVLGPLT